MQSSDGMKEEQDYHDLSGRAAATINNLNNSVDWTTCEVTEVVRETTAPPRGSADQFTHKALPRSAHEPGHMTPLPSIQSNTSHLWVYRRHV